MDNVSSDFNLRDYLSAVRRRLPLLVAVVISITVISILLAWLLPPVYRSQAIILIEQQEIPSDLIRSTVTSYADQRIQVISQRVMTSSNLTQIIENYELYLDERKREPIQLVVEEMREDIELEMISADVVDSRSGRPTSATIAFQLAFESSTPQTAQRVANELVSLYLNENIKERTEAASETADFLTQEADGLRKRVEDLEGQLAEFKSKNVRNRPELEQVTRDIINRAELQLIDVQKRIDSAEQQEILLSAELTMVEPNRVGDTPGEISAFERLRAVEAELSAAEAAYGEKHPDVRRLRKQAEALRVEVEPGAARDLYEQELSAARSNLSELLETYGQDHPDVKSAKTIIGNYELKLETLPEDDDREPENPIYVNIKVRLNSVHAEIRTLGEQRQQLQARIDEYTQDLLQIPDVEAEYRALMRDYESTLAKYKEITAKQMEARLSENLESENKGERFVLIEPPVLPAEPAKPNRGAILLIGVFLAVGGGIGTVGVAEALDTRVRGRRGVQELLSAPPLAAIPYFYGDESTVQRHRVAVAIAIAAVLTILAGFALVHFLYAPLDVLWFVMLRKIGV